MSDRRFAPPEGSIERGKVTRIEQYGAFVQLDRYRARGLVHISQLAPFKVEKVEDAVSIDDVVWVKVLEVNVETDEATGKQRHKIRLSIKSASQDGSAQDFDQSSTNDAAQSRLEQNLTSSIGMGVGLDPMASISNGNDSSKLVLKNQTQNAMIINGYALVDDTEGEPVQPPPQQTLADTSARPMGRGRGTTLPAWMTRGSGDAGPTPGKDDDDSRTRRRKHKHKKKDTRRKRHHKRRKHSDRQTKHRDRKRHRRGGDSEEESNSSASFRDRSSVQDGWQHDGRSERRRNHKRRDRKRQRRSRSHSVSPDDYSRSSREDDRARGSGRYRRHRRRRSRSASGSGYSRSSRDDDDIQFTSLDDAKSLIADLERKRR